MKVKDLILSRQDVYSITEGLTVYEAARFLREKQVRSVGVCDESGKLIGIVSQSDISDKVAAENKCPAWMRVSEIMTPNPITVSPEVALDECLRVMEKRGVFHLPVIDQEGGYRGMISVSDLLKVMVLDEKARADMLEAFLFPQR